MASAQVLLTASVPTDDPLVLSGGKKLDNTGHIQKWDLNTGLGLGAPLKEFYFPHSGPSIVAPFPLSRSSDGISLVTGAIVSINRKTASLNYYLLGKERPVHRFFGQEPLSAMVVSPDGNSLVGGSEDGKVCIWDIPSGELLVMLESAHFQRISVLRISPDGTLLVSGSKDGSVKVWSWVGLMAGGKNPELTITEHTDAIEDVHICFGLTRNCRLLTAGMDKTARLFDLCDGQPLATLRFPVAISRVLMNCTETLVIAAGIDGNIYLVDLGADAQEILETNALAYDRDDSDLGSNHGVNCNKEFEGNILSGNHASITGIAFNMEESLLVSGDTEGNVIIWNISSRQVVRRIRSEGSLLWLGIVTKASLHAEMGTGQFHLIVGQPQRTITCARDSMPSFCQPRTVVPAHNQATPSRPDQALVVPTDSTDKLREGYSQLLNFVFSRLE